MVTAGLLTTRSLARFATNWRNLALLTKAAQKRRWNRCCHLEGWVFVLSGWWEICQSPRLKGFSAGSAWRQLRRLPRPERPRLAAHLAERRWQFSTSSPSQSTSAGFSCQRWPCGSGSTDGLDLGPSKTDPLPFPKASTEYCYCPYSVQCAFIRDSYRTVALHLVLPIFLCIGPVYTLVTKIKLFEAYTQSQCLHLCFHLPAFVNTL